MIDIAKINYFIDEEIDLIIKESNKYRFVDKMSARAWLEHELYCRGLSLSILSKLQIERLEKEIVKC